MLAPLDKSAVLDCIPHPDVVRHRLVIAITETDLLRKLLKLALRAEQEQERLARLQPARGAANASA